MTYKGVARGKTIELEEPLPYPEGQPVSVSVEPLRTQLTSGSPGAIRRAMHEAPHVRAEDVDALERAIAEGKLQDTRKVNRMPQLMLEVPDTVAQQLARLAAAQNKSVEQVALEQLTSALESAAESLEERYERFFRDSGLFVEEPAEHGRPSPPLSEENLDELATKLGAAGPLSEVIIEERGQR